MKTARRRHDIFDETWVLLETHLPGRKGVWGGIAEDDRLFSNAVFWIFRAGAPWREPVAAIGTWAGQKGAQHQDTLLAAAQIRCLVLWLNIS